MSVRPRSQVYKQERKISTQFPTSQLQSGPSLPQARSTPKRPAAGRAGRRQSAAAAAQNSAAAGGFWPTISGAEREALNGPDFEQLAGMDVDGDLYALRVGVFDSRVWPGSESEFCQCTAWTSTVEGSGFGLAAPCAASS